MRFCLLAFLLFGGALHTAAQFDALLTNPSACALALPIGDNRCADGEQLFDPNQFGIQVNNAPGTTLGVDVYLKEVRLLIAHQWAGDLDISLVSPGGVAIDLSTDNGGTNDHFGDVSRPGCEGYVTLAVAACTRIDDDQAAVHPYTDQPYLPEMSLLGFNDGQTDPNGTWILRVCDDFEQDTGRLEFVELVFEPIACLPVTELQITGVDSTTVVLNWAALAGCEASRTLIEYGPPGFTPGSSDQPGQGTLVEGTCPPFALKGLAAETDYDIYVRRACGGGTTSGNSCVVRVRTGCQPPPGPVSEDFDDQEDCPPDCRATCVLTGIWQNSGDDDQDWLVRSGLTPTTGTGPSGDLSGAGKYIYMEASGTACPLRTRAVLNSGCFLFSKGGSDTCHLAFSYHLFGADAGSLALEATNNGGATWAELWSVSGNRGNRWNKVYLSLSRFTEGDILQFRFIGTKGNGALGDIALDGITVYGSSYLGQRDDRFFADTDGDGFGDPAVFIETCLGTPPAGYVTDSTDCDDNDPTVFPGAPEIACDGVDNNCNGLQDDLLLPPPLVFNDTICSGEIPRLTALPVSGKFILWYDQPAGENLPPAFGEVFSPDIPANEGPLPVIYRFYAEETDLFCTSATRAEATLVVNPRPAAVAEDPGGFCPGQMVDLDTLPLADARSTGGRALFYSTPDLAFDALVNAPVTMETDTTFYFQMVNPYGCTDTGSARLILNSGPDLVVSSDTALSLCIESEQQLTVAASGGLLPYRFQWNTGATDSSIRVTSGREEGREHYSVTVTDAGGCFSTAEVNIEVTSSIDSVRRSIQSVSVCGGTDGAIRIEPLNGAPPFDYQWAGANGIIGDSQNVTSVPFVITGLAQGAYRITITDNSDEECQFRMRTAYVNGPDAEVRDISIEPVSCQGAADGKICLDVRGTVTYLWSDGSIDPCVDGLSPGFYSVTITSGDCTTVLDSLEITEPNGLQLASSLRLPSCSDGSDGRVALEAFGGTGPYSFSWSNGSSGNILSGVGVGLYDMTLTDSRGCMLTESFVLPAPAPLEIRIDSLRTVSCVGIADGYVRLAGSGGTAPYRFAWSDGYELPVRDQLPAGTYTVSLTDHNGCQTFLTDTLKAPAPLKLFLADRKAPICLGDASGFIQLAASGGKKPYHFRWNTGADTSFLTGLGVGVFSAVLEDANGCATDSLTVTLEARSAPGLDVVVQPPTCPGVANGILTALPRGVSPYQYLWNTGDTTATLGGIGEGAYALTVTDAEGCLVDTSLAVVPAEEPILVDFAVFPPSCPGAADALIDVQVLQAAAPPLNFSWNDGATAEDRRDISPGKYTLTITDADGCRFRSDTLDVTGAVPLNIELAGFGPIACRGDQNGFLEVAVSGGTPPYRYSWEGLPDTGSLVTGLGAGAYRVFVTDAAGCPLTASYQLAAPPAFDVSLEIDQGEKCDSDTLSILTARAQGGVAPYTYRWSTGAETASIDSVSAGDYGVIVRDANRCAVLFPSIKVRTPEPSLRLDSFKVRDISCFGRQDGRMTAHISGGRAPFQFLFSNANFVETSQREVTIRDLPADNDYRVTVVDALGCSVVSDLKVIREPGLLNLRRDSLNRITCTGAANGGIFVTALGGTAPFAYNWFDSLWQPVAITEDLTFARTGVYYGVVTDARLCADTLGPIDLDQRNSPLELADTTILDVLCKGERTGAIALSLTGGRMPYSFRWSNGSRTQNLAALPAGAYALTVTDADSCITVFPGLQIAEPETEIRIQPAIVDVLCAGGNDGFVEVVASGGAPPYAFTWEAGGAIIGIDTGRIAGLTAGNYRLTLQDSIGCSQIYTFQVDEPAPLGLSFETVDPQPDQDNGLIKAQVTGGNPPYLYAWNTGDSTSIVFRLTSGDYTVTVTDANDCILTDSIRLVATGVRIPRWLETLELFPNPASDELQVRYALNGVENLEMELFDAYGRSVWKKALSLIREGHERIGLELFPAGIYQFRLATSSGEKVLRRVVIVR